MNKHHNKNSHRRHRFIKVCGQMYTGTVDCAVAYGADYVGFNFCTGSERYVSPSHVARMKSALVKRVGVFSSQGTQEILDIMQESHLHMAQLQGCHSVSDAATIGSGRVMRVLRVEKSCTRAALQEEVDAWAPFCCAFLVECEDAALLRRVEFPHPWVLSGRMELGKLQRMLHLCSPDGVDIDSCAESSELMAAMRTIS